MHLVTSVSEQWQIHDLGKRGAHICYNASQSNFIFEEEYKTKVSLICADRGRGGSPGYPSGSAAARVTWMNVLSIGELTEMY